MNSILSMYLTAPHTRTLQRRPPRAPTVRFGRVPKREKAKILAAMQSVNARSQEKALISELEDEAKLISSIIQAHNETCDFTRDKVRPMLEQARSQPIYTTCPPQMACPLNPNPHPLQNGQSHIMEDFSERFSPAIRGVVEFAKRIPGFNLLSQDDQVTLLKAGVFEVLLVRLACMFDSTTNTMVCLNGQVVKRDSLSCASNARFLMDSMFDFSERLNGLKLTESELALFCSIVVIAVDRPGLRNLELVEKMHTKLIQALQTTVDTHHPHNHLLFQELMKKIPDLRTLNTLHSEKLLAFKMEPRNKMASEPCSTFVPGMEDQWNRYAEKWHQNGAWSPSSSSDPFGSPRSVDSSQGIKSPGSSSKGFDCESVCSVEVAQINELNVRHHDEQNVSGDENDSPRCPFKMRKLDSPTDSGIESGKEHAAHSTPTASICSSPRSSIDEKVKDISDSEVPDKSESIDDMPVLKRALQAPPLINTNLLMDEAYKPHKKFRAFRKDSLDGPCSPESSVNNSNHHPTTKAPLASMHSTLVQTLQQGPKYLSEQQMKRTDFIHNMIMTNDNKSNANPATPMCNTVYHQQQPQNVSSTHFIPSSSVVSSSTKMPGTNVPTYIPHASWPYSSAVSNLPVSQSMPVFVKNSTWAAAKSPSMTTQQVMPRMYYDPRNQSSSPCSTATQSSTPLTVNTPSFTTTSILAAQLAAPLNTVAPSRNQSPHPRIASINIAASSPQPPMAVQNVVSSGQGRSSEQQPLNLSKRTPSPPPINV